MCMLSKITVEMFLEMASRGDFEPIEEHHVELIRGVIIPRFGDDPTIHRSLHQEWLAGEIMEWSFDVVSRERVRIRVQSAIGLPEFDSVPISDLGWAIRKRYFEVYPTAEEMFLVIDVFDSSLSKDRGPKLELYAEANIREYWIVNIQSRCIDVYRDPAGLIFRDIKSYVPREEIHPLGFPEVSLAVSRLFPD